MTIINHSLKITIINNHEINVKTTDLLTIQTRPQLRPPARQHKWCLDLNHTILLPLFKVYHIIWSSKSYLSVCLYVSLPVCLSAYFFSLYLRMGWILTKLGRCFESQVLWIISKFQGNWLSDVVIMTSFSSSLTFLYKTCRDMEAMQHQSCIVTSK